MLLYSYENRKVYIVTLQIIAAMADEAAIEALEHIGEPLVLYLAELGYLMQQQNPDFRGGF